MLRNDAGDVGGALEQSAQVPPRLLSARDTRLRPSNVGPSSGAIWSSVAESAFSDWFSVSVLVPAMLVVRSETASLSE